ncbi:hypothetical protein [Massilia sp. Root1485]|uniref:hypothetical protein n=1 Tax=Massilia sp. Root1485 TaxID=1736472 RepID=UPI0006F37D89|nr:hypothetical protein [Massilia sp. Root1485]KQZ47511.1 hypothetical protein ASD92_00475 [Massilia sp. Root1485]
MKLALSTIALGVGLACASLAASGQTITVTQQGSGNTAAAEQVNTTPEAVIYSSTTASITQIGNDNHVGGPGGTSAGIFQILSPNGGARALVTQTGTGNNAGITQDGRPGPNPPPVTAVITQQGNGNDAAITQTHAVSNDVSIDQNGSANLARLLQVDTGDASFHITQNGTGNTTTAEHLRSSHGGPQVNQTGEGNTVAIYADNLLGPGARITQDGSVNSANVLLIDTDIILTLSQQGVGNVVNASESGAGFADISQSGNGNIANLTQANGFLKASIVQIGNINGATVNQSGPFEYVANVNQSGSGNWSNVYQH